jgi:hypothetical protein
LQEELDAALTLMAILVLHSYSQLEKATLQKIAPEAAVAFHEAQSRWRSRIVELVENIGRRALVSKHTEILAKYWLLDHLRKAASGKFLRDWRRLEALREHMKEIVTQDDISQLRRYYQGAILRTREKSLIARALARASGLAVPLEADEVATCEVSDQLIHVYRTSIAVGQNRVHATHIKKLRELLEDMQSGRLENIVLLQPLPELGR